MPQERTHPRAVSTSMISPGTIAATQAVGHMRHMQQDVQTPSGWDAAQHSMVTQHILHVMQERPQQKKQWQTLYSMWWASIRATKGHPQRTVLVFLGVLCLLPLSVLLSSVIWTGVGGLVEPLIVFIFLVSVCCTRHKNEWSVESFFVENKEREHQPASPLQGPEQACFCLLSAQKPPSSRSSKGSAFTLFFFFFFYTSLFFFFFRNAIGWRSCSQVLSTTSPLFCGAETARKSFKIATASRSKPSSKCCCKCRWCSFVRRENQAKMLNFFSQKEKKRWGKKACCSNWTYGWTIWQTKDYSNGDSGGRNGGANVQGRHGEWYRHLRKRGFPLYVCVFPSFELFHNDSLIRIVCLRVIFEVLRLWIIFAHFATEGLLHFTHCDRGIWNRFCRPTWKKRTTRWWRILLTELISLTLLPVPHTRLCETAWNCKKKKQTNKQASKKKDFFFHDLP